MATIKTSRGLTNRLVKGKFESVQDLKTKILNPSEMNYLVLLEEEIDAISALLADMSKSSEQLGLGKTDVKRIQTEIALATADPFEEGYLVEEHTTYNTIKTYIDLLNKTDLSTEKYELGHETGVFTRLLQLTKENYNPITNKSFHPRQKILIEKAIKASIIIDTIDDNALSKIKKYISDNKLDSLGTGSSAKDLETILRAASSTMELSITTEKNITGKLHNKTLKITLRPELESLNQFTGKLSGNLSRMVGAAFKAESAKPSEIDRILKSVDMFNLTGSPSYTTILSKDLDSILPYDKKRKKKVNKYKASKVRVKRRIPNKNQAAVTLKKRIKKRVVGLKTKLLAIKSKKKFIIPTITLKALINQSLNDFIQLRMANSNAPSSREYLRYQTGRFSESAKLLTLNRQQTGTYFGVYTYQQEPYAVFEQGNKMGSPGRDPRLYIEGAAREIAVQVLKKQFKGIALESK